MNDKRHYLLDVLDDCREYADRYGCSLAEAIDDWEGDGPNGSWGLGPDEKAAVWKLSHGGAEEGAK